MNCRALHTGPLFKPDGTSAVHDHPRLAALKRATSWTPAWREKWARAHGDVRAQHRLVRQEYGIADPMPEHVKEQLRARAATPEAIAKRKQKAEERRRLRSIMKARRVPRRRRAS